MPNTEILPGIYWVGAVDYRIRHFHGYTYTTQRGTTYNAYLIVDEKIALVDTVYAPFTKEFIEKISAVVEPSKIDYIIANHVETDHSGALPELIKLCPKAKVMGTAKCKEGLQKYYYANLDFQVVKSMDTLKLGKRTLTFLEAPMLHWPDSMFTYIAEDALLLPNDAFGQHLATAERFDDEVDQAVLMEEAVKYYANILWPLGGLVVKKIEQVVKLGIPIKIIAPSHGIIWRKDPSKIINAYMKWGKNETKPEVVIAYETMWGSTAKMAQKIAEGLKESGVPAKAFDINETDRTSIITEMLEAKGFIIGSSTHDNNMLPNMAGLLELLKGFKPKNRIAAAFGSHGWAGGALKQIEGILGETGIKLGQTALAVQYAPDKNELKQCHEFGKAFADKVKGEA